MITRLIISLSSRTKNGAERRPNSIIVIFTSLKGINFDRPQVVPIKKKRKKKKATVVVLSELSHSTPARYASFYHPAGRARSEQDRAVGSGKEGQGSQGRDQVAQGLRCAVCFLPKKGPRARRRRPSLPPVARPSLPISPPPPPPPQIFRARTRAEHERSLLAFARRRSREDVSSVL